MAGRWNVTTRPSVSHPGPAPYQERRPKQRQHSHCLPPVPGQSPALPCPYSTWGKSTSGRFWKFLLHKTHISWGSMLPPAAPWRHSHAYYIAPEHML